MTLRLKQFCEVRRTIVGRLKSFTHAVYHSSQDFRSPAPYEELFERGAALARSGQAG
jgi:hypothetical protein